MGIYDKQYDVFISYKSKNVDLARLIADALIYSGKSVWFNEYQVLLVERSRFQEFIDQGISKSQFGIALTNDDYAKSEYCEKEMEQLLRYCGAKNILEVRIPPEPETRQKYPQLAESPGCIYTGNAEQVLKFISQKTGWKIPAPVKDLGRPGKDIFEGDCLGKPYNIDVSGWKLVERSFYGGGPCYAKKIEGFNISWNLQYGEEFSPTAYQARLNLNQKDDRDLYNEMCDYANRYATQYKSGLKVAGAHLFFLGGISHFAMTYQDGAFWKRRHSIMLSHPITKRVAEFLFTFQFPGTYKQYCRYCQLMDNLVRSLQWEKSEREQPKKPAKEEKRVAQIIDNQPMANKFNSEGLMYAKQGRLKEGIAAWEKALDYTSQAELRSMSLFNIGRAYEKMGDSGRAIKNYIKSVEANPEQFNALSNIGSIYLRQNNLKEALTYLSRALDKNPTDYITINNIIICYERLGLWKEAETFREALKRFKQ